MKTVQKLFFVCPSCHRRSWDFTDKFVSGQVGYTVTCVNGCGDVYILGASLTVDSANREEVKLFRVRKCQRLVEELGLDREALLADGFEGALIGSARIFNRVVALYDRAVCIEILMEGGCTEEEAEEFFEFNVVGSFVGDYTPAFAILAKE